MAGLPQGAKLEKTSGAETGLRSPSRSRAHHLFLVRMVAPSMLLSRSRKQVKIRPLRSAYAFLRPARFWNSCISRFFVGTRRASFRAAF